MLIYKIFRADEWEVLEAEGRTKGAPIDLADGYIHFSTADTVVETASKYFGGLDGLMLVACDSEAMGDDVRWEPSRGGALFPHLYRELRLADVLWAAPLPCHSDRHLFPETVAGHIDPSRASFDAFKALDRDHPIEMLNLVRLRSKAEYPHDHELAGAGLSGGDAYGRYGRETAPILRELGAGIVWRGDFQAVLIGPGHEHWDHVFVARYPTAHAFLAMVTDPRYRQAVIHRQAAVRTSRLIRCRPTEAGTEFG